MKINLAQFKYDFVVSLLNFVVACALWSSGQIQGPLGCFFSISIFLIYCLYFLNLSLYYALLNFIYFYMFSNFIFSMTYRHLIGNSTLYMLKFNDILLLIIFCKTLADKKIGIKKYLTNKICLLFFSIYALGSLSSIVNSVSIFNFVNALWIYFRILPIFVASAFCRPSFTKNNIIWFCGVNIIATIILIPLCINGLQDDIAGLFGFCGARAFTFLAIALYSFSIYTFIIRGAKKSHIILSSILYFSWCALGENKIPLLYGFVIAIVALLVVSIRFNSFIRLLRKIAIILSVSLVTILAFVVLLYFHPEWFVIVQEGVLKFFNQYTQTQQVGYIKLGRFEVFNWIYDNVLGDLSHTLFGIGIGNGMPSDLANYHIMNYIMGISDNSIVDLYITPFYAEYGWSLGYHNSGLTILLLETGIFGVIIYVIAMLCVLFHLLFLLKQYKNVGAYFFAGLNVVIYLLISSVYYDNIFQFNCQFIIYIILGIVYSKISKEI